MNVHSHGYGRSLANFPCSFSLILTKYKSASNDQKDKMKCSSRLITLNKKTPLRYKHQRFSPPSDQKLPKGESEKPLRTIYRMPLEGWGMSNARTCVCTRSTGWVGDAKSTFMNFIKFLFNSANWNAVFDRRHTIVTPLVAQRVGTITSNFAHCLQHTHTHDGK